MQGDAVETNLGLFFETLSRGEQTRFLRKLIKRLARDQPDELRFLRSLLLAVPEDSLLERLPSEVLARVLSHTDLATLRRLSTCGNRTLAKAIFEDFRPWLAIWNRPSTAKSVATWSFLDQEPSATLKPAAIAAALHYEAQMTRRWRSGAFRSDSGGGLMRLACHGSSVITCLEADSALEECLDGQLVQGPAGRRRTPASPSHIAAFMTGSDDGSVRLWALADGRQLGVFMGHAGGVWAMRADWQRGLLVTGSTDRTLVLWDLSTGQRLRDFLGHTSTVRCVELIDGEWIVSGSRDGTLRVWSVASGSCLHVLKGHTGSVRCLAVLRHRQRTCIVSGSYDGTGRIWDLQSGKCLRILSGHENKVYSVACTRNGRFVATGSLDGTVRIWEPFAGSHQHRSSTEMDFAHSETQLPPLNTNSDSESDAARAPLPADPATARAASEGQTIAAVHMATGHRGLVGLVHIHGALVVSAATDGSLQLLDTARPGFPTTTIPAAHPASITSLAVNQRGMLVTGSEGLVRLWAISGKDSDAVNPSDRTDQSEGRDNAPYAQYAQSVFESGSFVREGMHYPSSGNGSCERCRTGSCVHLGAAGADEPILRPVANLMEGIGMVWQVNMSASRVIIGYQAGDKTHVQTFNFAPSWAEVLERRNSETLRSSNGRSQIRRSKRLQQQDPLSKTPRPGLQANSPHPLNQQIGGEIYCPSIPAADSHSHSHHQLLPQRHEHMLFNLAHASSTIITIGDENHSDNHDLGLNLDAGVDPDNEMSIYAE